MRSCKKTALIPTRRTGDSVTEAESTDALRILAGIGIAQGIVDTGRLARLVREPVRFTIRQARRRHELGRYRVRESGEIVHLRHNTPDVNTLDELFRLGHYEMPAEVLDALATVEPPLRIADLGANIGLFGAFVRGRFAAVNLVGFEPDEGNAAVHDLTIRANGAEPVWELVRACAATEDGVAHLSSEGFTTARVEESGRVVPAVDVFAYLASVDLLKIDVEGAEWDLLRDPRFGSLACRAVALEYHPYRCPTDNPRELAHQLLRDAGFATADHELSAIPNQGMVWGWRKS
jgi:FkbM family methyltransferase